MRGATASGSISWAFLPPWFRWDDRLRDCRSACKSLGVHGKKNLCWLSQPWSMKRVGSFLIRRYCCSSGLPLVFLYYYPVLVPWITLVNLRAARRPECEAAVTDTKYNYVGFHFFGSEVAARPDLLFVADRRISLSLSAGKHC